MGMGTIPNAIGWQGDAFTAACHDARAWTGGELGTVEARVGRAALGGEEAAELADDDARSGADRAAAAVGRGLFARLFAGADAAPAGGPAWAQAVAGALAGPALDGLAEQTRGDGDMAALAGALLLSAVEEQIPGILEALAEAGIEPDEDPADLVDGDGEPVDGDLVRDVLAEAGEGLAAAVAAAADAATAAVGEARVALNGVLPGLGSRPPEFGAEDPGRMRLVERLRADRRLQQVLRVAGRIHRIADRVRQQRTAEVRSEVVDLEQGGDVAQILASQLVGLVEPDLELLTLAGIADRSLLQYRLEGQERIGRGPIVALLDVSGSMEAKMADGLDRIGWAAAIGIATVRAGVEQRRDVAVATFDDVVTASWRVRSGDLAGAQAAVLALAGIRPGAGTSFNGPINWALDAGAERDRADLVLVTDGEANASDHVVQRLEAARGRGLRLWGILVGAEARPGTVDAIADGVARCGLGGDDAELIGALGAT